MQGTAGPGLVSGDNLTCFADDHLAVLARFELEEVPGGDHVLPHRLGRFLNYGTSCVKPCCGAGTFWPEPV